MEKAFEWMGDGGKTGNQEIPVRKSLLPKFQEKDHKGLDWGSGIEGDEEEIDKENLLKIKQTKLLSLHFNCSYFKTSLALKAQGLEKPRDYPN